MKVRLYFDEDTFRHALVHALQQRGIDVLTPLEVDMGAKTDKEQLEYAAHEDRTLYTFNTGDFCRLHDDLLQRHKHHAGIVVAQQQTYSVGEQMRRLLKLTATLSAEEMHDRLEFLSDWA